MAAMPFFVYITMVSTGDSLYPMSQSPFLLAVCVMCNFKREAQLSQKQLSIYHFFGLQGNIIVFREFVQNIYFTQNGV